MAGTRAAAIVQDLLTLARRGVQLKEAIDVNQVVSEFLVGPEYDNLRANHPGIEVILQLAENLPAIRGSRVHLVKMVMNLTMNAAEAMPDGGRIVVVSEFQTLKEGKRMRDRPAGDYVVLSVIDNGTGIPAEDISRIFEPFYTKKVMGRSGTGLGMAIVWATMQDHEGFVQVHSTVGKGTIIRLFFPATNEVQPPKPAVPKIEDLMGHGETVLVVDDEAEHRHIAYEMLTRLNYQVSVVESDRAALDHMAKSPSDVVLLDMVLGNGSDGLTLYRQLLARHPRQKAIIVSGFDESTRVKKALTLGAGDYIHKPYTLQQLSSAVRTALEKR
jgi:two-component system cell cycle sensor histidine kinase/response regulator CckA